MDNRPIGVFDSGLGGLTALKEIIRLMPNESTVYFGDNGRAPYGTKSRETVVKFTLQDVRFLINQDIKMVVIACNTASACALEAVKNSFDIPVIEVVNPGAAAAVRETKTKRVAIIGTPATINSGIYERAIHKLDGSIEVFSAACPMLVPLVEEGWWDNEIAYLIVKEYLTKLKSYEVDTLVLGCTHYPLLKDTIAKIMGEEVKLVSSAEEVAKVVEKMIMDDNSSRDESVKPVYRYYTSDSTEKFEALGSTILNKNISSVEKVDIEKY